METADGNGKAIFGLAAETLGLAKNILVLSGKIVISVRYTDVHMLVEEGGQSLGVGVSV